MTIYSKHLWGNGPLATPVFTGRGHPDCNFLPQAKWWRKSFLALPLAVSLSVADTSPVFSTSSNLVCYHGDNKFFTFVKRNSNLASLFIRIRHCDLLALPFFIQAEKTLFYWPILRVFCCIGTWSGELLKLDKIFFHSSVMTAVADARATSSISTPVLTRVTLCTAPTADRGGFLIWGVPRTGHSYGKQVRHLQKASFLFPCF